jgi:XTP/dITP diphosphohydrolase
VRGTCEGSIAYTKAGNSGFGYDPVFWLKDRKLTMAELSHDEKNKISHRWDAFSQLKELL